MEASMNYETFIAEQRDAVTLMPRITALANKEMVNIAFETVLEHGPLYERPTWQILAATED